MPEVYVDGPLPARLFLYLEMINYS